MSPSLRRVRAILAAREDVGPHDFIREAPGRPDSRVRARELTARLPAEDDLRMLVPSSAGELGLFCRKLLWDSAFFGTAVARLDEVIPLEGPRYPIREDLGPPVAALRPELQRRGIRQVFSIVDSRDVAVCRGLAEDGWAPIESRLTFYRPLHDLPRGERHRVRRARPGDLPSLAAAAVSAVNPHDRFHADPLVQPVDADRLMAAWVEASVQGTFADAVVVPDAPSPTAFGTVRFLREYWSGDAFRPAQFVLGAVGPEWRGWYVKLVEESCRIAREEGATHMLLGTQAANRAAVRTCEKLGFRYGRSSLVLRADLSRPRQARARRTGTARER